MLLLLLCGCLKEPDSSLTTLEKDGTVTSVLVESFDASYYDEEELKQMILEESADYNRTTGKSAVSVEKVSVEDGIANVKMTYESAADFAAFNDCIFFDGTVQEALDAGYDLNLVLSSVKNAQETAGFSDISAMSDARVLITDSTEPVKLPGKALYISESATTDRKYRTVTREETSSEPVYIIYAS